MPAAEPVLIRMPRDGSQPFAEIVWPLEPASSTPGDVTCWGYIGQHSAADLTAWVAETRPATAEEQAAALRQWRGEGPDRSETDYPIRVLRRAPSWATIMAAHREALRA